MSARWLDILSLPGWWLPAFFVGVLGLVACTRPELAQRVDLPPGVFQQALEQFVSARTLSWQDDSGQVSGTITPIRTFRNVDGVYCREYTANYVDANRGGIAWRGIACRSQDRIWRHTGEAMPV